MINNKLTVRHKCGTFIYLYVHLYYICAMNDTKKYTIMNKKESKKLYIRELAKIDQKYNKDLFMLYTLGLIALSMLTYILFI